MTEIKHIIWDWNGTLFDDAWLCVEIVNRLLAKRGLPIIDEARYQDEFVFPVETYYRNVGFDLAREPFADLADEYMAHYDRRRFECSLQPQARAVVATLSSRGYTQHILSATEQSRLEEMVSHADLRGQFARLVGIGDCLAGGKLDHGKDLVASLGCAVSEIVMIGDTPHDYEVASAIGMACVLIPSGHCSRERIAACGATVLDSVSELPALSASAARGRR